MDNSNVLALKYRPTKLTDLIGQESVTTTLTNAFQAKDLYTCFLFGGQFGGGKTTTARILAAMENCEEGPTIEPCGKCKMCRDIFDGQSSDIKEVNAASDNGIDVIRRLEDFVSSRPLLARVKYVILDEAHALSRQAAESALKLLEEPPHAVRFILCTTDTQKLKATIHSRSMPFRFVKVPWPQIAEHLKNICAKENINADEASLRLAARLSDGSLRNSLRNLQVMSTYAGGKPINADIAQMALGAVSDSSYFDLIESILGKDPTGAIKVINGAFSKGHDVDQIISGLTEHLRTLLVLTSCQNTGGLVYLSEDEKKRYVHQIKRMSIYLVTDLISLLYEVGRGVSVNLNPQTLLESFAIKAMFAVSNREKQAAQAK